MRNQIFKEAYAGLTTRMKALANQRDEIYVPNIVPDSTVDYIFVCMEPTLGEWAMTRDEAEIRLGEGFTNFLDGYNTMLLHYAIKLYLCKINESYHLTDLSKGAMMVGHAAINRKERYKGQSGGLTIVHCHIHLVPRRDGDVENPGGGIRHFISGKGFY